jgi:hypothetical protein
MNDLIVISDAGKDQDDELMFLLMASLVRQGVLNPLVIVANLAPALLRARLVKGQLKLTGLPTPVGVGTDCGVPDQFHDHEFEHVPYLAPPEEIMDGNFLLVSALYAAEDKSLTLLLVSGLTDAANVLRQYEDLFLRKVRQVVIMGGVIQCCDAVQLDEDGFMTPDSASNNNFDPEAAAFLYRRLQELGLPMTILSRQAAYSVKVARAAYDRMAASGHPVGAKLAHVQRVLADDFWRKCNLQPGDPRRGKVPDRWTRQLFCETFCGGLGADRSPDGSIADLVEYVVLSDPMTLLAAVPELCQRFYVPEAVTVRGVEHRIIGLSKSKTGVRDPGELAGYLVEQILSVLGSEPSTT